MMAVKRAESKRKALDKEKAILLAVISIASVLVVASLVISKGLWGQGNYYTKVANQKEKALDQLKDNQEAVTSLRTAYEEFTSRDPNLMAGSRDGKEETDGDNAKLILDALPSKYDFPALASSVEKLLTGHTINNIKGVDQSLAQTPVTGKPIPIEMPFTMELTTTYDGVRSLMATLDSSIRPFQLTKIEFSGINAKLETMIEAKTYYLPETGLQVTTGDVQ